QRRAAPGGLMGQQPGWGVILRLNKTGVTAAHGFLSQAVIVNIFGSGHCAAIGSHGVVFAPGYIGYGS
ncbi:hypothetical protein, partial [Photorhabdus khanii]|uniref:hypothetical protein n=1 Tax=Photorhabdus khanii TaxID=1004150 RepID=UPI00195FE900